VPQHIKEATKLIAPEILAKFYGCGSPIPDDLCCKKVLDLGCGTGRDSYIIAYLAGSGGEVVGVDMTDEQLDIAKKYIEHQMKVFGFDKPNIKFLKGYIEDLKTIGLEDSYFDKVVSNCVVNLSARKDMVFSEVYRVLKENGEFYFSDVFSDRVLPEWMKDDPVLVGECLGGALYVKDFETLADEAGFVKMKVVSKTPIEISNPEIKDKVGEAKFVSITYSLRKK
jgi:ubiquinone/menaquinone biosynthesis C-methylase UbiE